MPKLNFKEDFSSNQNLGFYKKNLKIGLDIDEVLANFVGGFMEYHKRKKPINNFYFTYNISVLMDLKPIKEFWMNLEPLCKPEDIPFIPHCYVSKRYIPVKWTEEWLEMHGFPCKPVIHVEGSKVAACKEAGVELFVDDSLPNFQELNNAGIDTFLYDACHNQQYDVGEYRIVTLKDIIFKI